MPTYDFLCRKCGEHVEVQHGMLEPHPTIHADVGIECSGVLVRVFYPIPDVWRATRGVYKYEKVLGPNDVT